MTFPNRVRVISTISLLVLFFSPIHRYADSNEIYLPFPEEENAPNQDTETSEKKKDLPETPPIVSKPILTEEQSLSNNPKKKKKKETPDPSLAPFKKGKAYLTRNQKKKAEEEFKTASSSEGKTSNLARVDRANLLGLDGNDSETNTLVEKQEDPDLKIKTQFEYARSLDTIGNKESEEKAYKEYLKLVTDFPKHQEITPKAHYAMGKILFRKKEFKAAVYPFVQIVSEFKESDEYGLALFHLGRIYESSWEDRDLERAVRYYKQMLKTTEGKSTPPGYQFGKEAKQRIYTLTQNSEGND